MTIRVDPLLVYQWDDGSRLFLEPFGYWDDKLGTNTIGWDLLLKQDGPRILARLRPASGPIRLSMPGTREDVEESISRFGSLLRGFILDAGMEPFWYLLSSPSSGFLLPVPTFVPDEKWDQRYELARTHVLDTGGRGPSPRPFLGVVQGLQLYVIARSTSGTDRDDLWVARAGRNTLISTMEKFEPTVDKVLENFHVLPERQRLSWTEENVRRGSWVVPDEGELEVFRLLGEPLPFWWDPWKLYEWYLERLSP